MILVAHSKDGHILFFNTIFYHFCPRAKHSGGRTKLPMSDVEIIRTFPPDQWCDDNNVSFYNLPNVGKHHPYKKRNEPFHTFTMFRDPAERLRSAFAFDRHGIKAQNKSPLSFEDYVRAPQIPNCQIKMVLGYGCHEIVETNKLDVSEAIRRVDSPFFFFGLTDRWDESLCLFHHWFGGKVEPFERRNNRKTNDKIVNRLTRSTLQPPPDADTVFVQALVEVFESRLHEANCTQQITTQQTR